MSIKRTITSDLRVCGFKVDERSGFFKILKYFIYSAILKPAFLCVFLYRVNRKIRKFGIFAKLLSVYRFYVFGIDISFLSKIGPGFKISHVSDIVIGAGVEIGSNFHVYNGVTIGAKNFEKPDEKPIIGNNVTIGSGAKVLGDIKIGNNVQIGALTFCNKSVPDNSVAYGNPVQIINK
jgi:serine O-acetyltransferase